MTQFSTQRASPEVQFTLVTQIDAGFDLMLTLMLVGFNLDLIAR